MSLPCLKPFRKGMGTKYASRLRMLVDSYEAPIRNLPHRERKLSYLPAHTQQEEGLASLHRREMREQGPTC